MIKKYLEKLYKSAETHKEEKLKRVLSNIPNGGILLDVGCWDGKKTLMWTKSFKAQKTLGLDILKDGIRNARKKGIEAYVCNIDNGKWPIKNNSVDCVFSNLVIEHLSNVDNFISESHRVLKKGGYTIVCTNNLSSWHNIICLLFGWAPFDLTNSSKKNWSIGNPFVLHKNEMSEYENSFTHKCVYTIKWLKDWYSFYKFKIVKTEGTGYYPLPNFIGKIDKTHAAYMILIFKK